MSVDPLLRRCAAIADDAGAATADDIAWLVGCFDHPLKVVQRRAGEAAVELAKGGATIGPVLEAAMGSGSLRSRWVATWAACRLTPASETATAVLLEVLGLDDGDLRWAAARLVTERVPRDTAIRRLTALVDEGNPEQRKMALYCLRDLGQSAPGIIARYRRALSDDAAGVRMAGMAALVRHARREPAIAGAVVELLADADGGVRRAAAASLGRLGVADDMVLSALRAAAGEGDPSLARAAQGAIDRLGS